MEKANLRIFRHRRGVLEIGGRTRLMGIVNITPDSFSDGGQYFEANRAAEHAFDLVKQGADIIDLGAESSRPGSHGVSADAQLGRLLPVLEVIRPETDAIISIDTRSSIVAKFCLAIGADVINDISGLADDSELAPVCNEHNAGLILMHMRGTPATMQQEPHYVDVVAEVAQSLFESVAIANHHGIQSESILVDPGLGFGKSFTHNYALLRNLSRLSGLGAGILVGPSRKAFTGEFSGLPASARQFSTAAAVAIAVMNGADVIRVHDVAEMKQVTEICDRYSELTNG